MRLPSRLHGRYPSDDSPLLLSLTFVLAAADGVVLALRFLLRERNAQGLGLSAAEWVTYTVGPALVEPALLFGVLYYASARCEQLPPLFRLLPGLAAAVVVGGGVGQLLGAWLFPTGWTPVARVGTGAVFVADLRALPVWRDLLEPFLRSLLTAVAAVGVAQSRLGQD